MLKKISVILFLFSFISCGDNNETSQKEKSEGSYAEKEILSQQKISLLEYYKAKSEDEEPTLNNILSIGLFMPYYEINNSKSSVSYYSDFNFKKLELSGEYKNRPEKKSYYSLSQNGDLLKISRHNYEGHCNYNFCFYPYRDFIIVKCMTFWDDFKHGSAPEKLNGFMVYSKKDSLLSFFAINILWANKKIDSTTLINNLSSISILNEDSYPKESHYFAFGEEFFYTKSLYDSAHNRNDFIYSLSERFTHSLGVKDDFIISDSTKLNNLFKKLGGHDTGYLISKIEKKVTHNLPSWFREDDLY